MQSEINFSIDNGNRVLENDEDLHVKFYTTPNFDDKKKYIVQIQQKEKIIYSE